MTKRNYLGPDLMFRQRLRNQYRDLQDQLGKCRPQGMEYDALTALAEQVAATHQILYGEPIAPSIAMGASAGG